MIDDDARLQQGAYITDGFELYEVRGLQGGREMIGISLVWVVVENCRNLRDLEFLAETIKRSFELVRVAPVPSCPDTPQGIAWWPTLGPA